MGETQRVEHVVLHVGAHRTGTGSFQGFLAQNQQLLVEAGIAARFPGRDISGEGNLRLKLPDPAVFKAKEALEPHINGVQRAIAQGPQAKTLLVCEENILGRMAPFYRGQFYSRLWRRADVLRQGLAGEVGRGPDQVVLVMRNYGDLFVSAYAQLAQIRKMPDFDQALPHLQKITRGWPVVIEALKKGLQCCDLRAVPYVDRGSNSELLGQMIKAVPEGLVDDHQNANVSASAEAIMALQSRFHAGETLDADTVAAIKADHSVSAGGSKFNPLSAAQKAAFTRRYNADLKLIKVSQVKT
ncbi:hypothetical protein [Algirhabdus cladophorae]|uniref:hypothetical protein n=1 Tax=Algirhabdus cladophorae TaxID=3377108 RepID=UPI003B84AE3A